MGDCDDPPVFDVVRQRAPVLRALDSTPTPTGDLVEVLDLSRSTIDRAVEDLAELGFVETETGGHVLTPAGDLAAAEYGRYEESLDGLAEASDVLADLPRDADVPPPVLRDARVVRPRRHVPGRPVQPFCDLLDSADSVRVFARAVVPAQVECCRRNAVADETPVELVATEPVVERLASDFREDLAEAMDTGRLQTRRAASSAPSYTLAVAERSADPAAGILIHSDRGLAGFVGTDGADAVSWARDRLDDCWTAATPLDPLDGG